MSPPSYLALSLVYWLHMLATVLWIGALASMALVTLPAVRQLDDPAVYVRLLAAMQKRLEPLGWLCLLTLLATGMFQMSANPNYAGFLAISNRWAAAILAKHLVFLAMTGVSAIITWGVLPALNRAALQQVHGLPAPEAARLPQRHAQLARLNLALGVLALLLTALARAA
jgi:uncharacterized membrane protein